VLAMLVAGCAGGEGRVTGVVTAAQGNLSGIESFVLRSTDGDQFAFEPEEGLAVFGDGATPLTHIFEHLQTGDPVRVTYRVEGNVNVALKVEDA